MTAILAFIMTHLSILTSIGPLVVGAGGVIFGIFRHQQAKVVEAKAASTVAQNNSAIDQGNATASAAGEQAVVNRAKADAEVAATPREDIDAQLAAIGAERKE